MTQKEYTSVQLSKKLRNELRRVADQKRMKVSGLLEFIVENFLNEKNFSVKLDCNLKSSSASKN